ncbi:MAG: PLP-dependent aminotransferase family protein [Pseudomonadota bacterium]|nr:PLP-dependent aminotransferase family protein [Pseudomonadota bacterium]MEC8129224.1 PLP-dependent aminotransferase family protein [Pseudomonadota bacterium]MEC8538570.1 PLP-dependent aminotransferase family protein [Pseudomonadota bacterium]
MLDHLIINLDAKADSSLQSQIQQSVVEAILARAILPGDKLPSSRALAGQLGVSRNTVVLAYQALIDTGYVQTRERSGYVVSSDAPVSRLMEPAAMTDPEGIGGVDWQDKLVGSRAGIRPVRKPLNWREYPFPFVYGQVDDELFSLTAWRDCARQALGMRNFGRMVGDFGLSDDPMLVNYICSRSLPRRGITARPEQILVTLGAQNALYLIAQLLVSENRHAVIEDPAYPDLRDILQQRTGNITALPVDSGGLVLDEEALAKSDVVFITPSHQCPTTHTMPASRRRALLELAERHDFLIVEDDYEFEMNFLEAATPALKSQDRDGRVIYVGSLSKSVFPGLRLGYLVAPEPLIEEARALRHLILRHPPGHAQRTLAYFMALGHYDAQIRRLRRHLARRRRTLQTALESHRLFTQSASHFGGTSFWVRGPEWLDSRLLAEHAASEGVLIEAGDVFYGPVAPPLNFFRLAYSSIPEGRIAEGVARLAAVVEKLRRNAE